MSAFQAEYAGSIPASRTGTQSATHAVVRQCYRSKDRKAKDGGGIQDSERREEGLSPSRGRERLVNEERSDEFT